MPPLPKLNISALSLLEQTLRDSPKDALLRDIARAEVLVDQVEDAQTYPEDWVIFRVTGSRPQLTEPAMIEGSALKAELSSLVERLCDAGKLGISDFGENSLIDADSLCRQWSMSRQTLSRLRRRGLVARRVLAESGKPRLMFSRDTVAKFAIAHPDAIARSAEYSRMGPELEARIVRRAMRYKRLLGYSLNAAAARIAERFGRSHEAVRQVLKRYERAAGARAAGRQGGVSGPIFNEADPLTDARREAVFRAWRLGVDPKLVCEQYRRSRAAVRRAVNVARAHRLSDLLIKGALTHHAPPQHPSDPLREKLLKRGTEKKTATRKIEISPLDSPPANAGLGAPVPRTINEIIAIARANTPPLGVEERTRVAAYQHLRSKVAETIAGLDRLFPQATSLDQAETMLRWAARLKVELIRSQFRLVIDTLEGRLERKVDDLPRSRLPKLMMEAIEAVAGAIDGLDPSHGGRLAAPVSLAVTKLAAKWARELQPVTLPPGTRLRAQPLLPNAPDIPDWSRTVCPWQRWLEPHFRTREAVDTARLAERERDFLRQRFGWYGGPPRTLAELGPEFGLSPIRVVVFEQRALRAARQPK